MVLHGLQMELIELSNDCIMVVQNYVAIFHVHKEFQFYIFFDILYVS